MDLDLDLTHRTVLIVGDAASARLAVARYRHAAAAVSLTIGADLTTVAGCRGVDRPKHLAGWRDLVDGIDIVVLVDAEADEERMVRAAAVM